MAVPRHKTSKSKKNSRRAHHALTPATTNECPRCSSPKLPHCVCEVCGFYKGEKKLEVEAY